MIVFEGIDASGKSTLALHVAAKLGMNIQESEGPPRFNGDLQNRVHNYSKMKNTLFVRHPYVSQPIYEVIRREKASIAPKLIQEFYETKPFFVYCDPAGVRKDHELKDHDKLEHIRAIEENYYELLVLYRMWAIDHASLIYRIGDDMDRIVRMLSCR